MSPIFWIIGSTIWFTFNSGKPTPPENFIQLNTRPYTVAEINSKDLPDIRVKDVIVGYTNDLESKVLTIRTAKKSYYLHYSGKPESDWFIGL
jgi:hypothetical protein